MFSPRVTEFLVNKKGGSYAKISGPVSLLKRDSNCKSNGHHDSDGHRSQPVLGIGQCRESEGKIGLR
jgi:hypothetical protein